MTKQTITHLDVQDLTAHPDNIRDDLGDLSEFAASTRQHGILQPLTATEHPDGGYLLLAGHRRLRAAVMAGLTRVPVIIRHGVTDPADQLVLMLVENCHRQDLNPMERADAYGALRNRGLCAADIARQTGSSLHTVRHFLRLLDLPEEEQEEIRAGHRAVSRALADAAAERQEERARQEGRPVGRPKGAKTSPWFGDRHRLATAVRRTCSHRGRVKVGGVGCGPCWEVALRQENDQQAADQAASQADEEQTP